MLKSNKLSIIVSLNQELNKEQNFRILIYFHFVSLKWNQKKSLKKNALKDETVSSRKHWSITFILQWYFFFFRKGEFTEIYNNNLVVL